jgi:two-component system alkaline phosphatase synthesis response regulator PhoP
VTDPAPRKIVVVIVEDDHYILDFMQFTLEQQGFTVIPAADGAEGFRLIRENLPLLVVLDLMLPKKDGFTILKEMSEIPEMACIPVVVVSAYTASESTRRMVQSQKNVKEVFTKPIKSKDFVAKLHQIIGVAP